MAGSLPDIQVDQYRRDGYLSPLRVLSHEQALACRATVEALEGGYADSALPHPANFYFRVNAHVVVPCVAEITRHPAVLDMVESILGPDLLVWSAELFIKEARTDKIVSWHQDLTYWGLGADAEQVTAWIAISPATVESGCMRFVPQSHRQDIQPHNDTFSDNNLLSRGQEIAVEVDESSAVDITLQPGEMSLHHGRMFHASGPNVSNDRRIGIAIRYVTPQVRQQIGSHDYAMLVRGIDRQKNWMHVAAPTTPFDPACLELHAEIRAEQTKALAQGVDNNAMYRGA